MKRIPVLVLLFCSVAVLAKAGDTNIPAADSKSKLAVIDVMSSSFEKSKSRMLTDNIRSALFNLRIFDIVERGAVQKVMQEQNIVSGSVLEDSDVLKIGRTMNVDKVFVCTIEKFNTMISVNVRIVNVATLLLDYTDNFYIRNEDQLLDAITEMVKKIEDNYLGRGKETLYDPAKRWAQAGASRNDADWLMANRADPDAYWALRQFDIRFSPAEYILVKKGGFDEQAIKRFFQSGISYNSVKRALSLGIVDVSTYREVWRPAGFSFEDYLDAYENGITLPSDYTTYIERFKKDWIVAGAGFVADKFPITDTQFKWFTGTIGWEHFWTRNQRDWYKISGEMGAHMLMLFDPVPYAQLNLYLGGYPFYGKIAVGAFYEFIMLNHYAGYLRLGMEIMEHWEWSILTVWGNQPTGTLPSSTSSETNAPIAFPYFGAMFTYKF
jgi:hypothetical protein